MARMKSILVKKEVVKAEETKVLSLRIPSSLAGRMDAVKKAADAAGFEVDLNAALIDHLAALVAGAERELKSVGSAGSATDGAVSSAATSQQVAA